MVVLDDNDRFHPPVEQAREKAQAVGAGLYSRDHGCTVPALVAQLDETVAAHPAVTPPAGAPAAEFATAAEAPGVVVDAAAALVDLLTAQADQPHIAAIPAAERSVIVDAVEEIGRIARSERATLAAADAEQAEAEAASAVEEQGRAEAEQAEQAAEDARAERAPADDAESPAPERRADLAPTPSGDPYPGYTGPRCYEPGGLVWHPCPS